MARSPPLHNVILFPAGDQSGFDPITRRPKLPEPSVFMWNTAGAKLL